MFDFINNSINTLLDWYYGLSILPYTLILISMIMFPLIIVVAYYTYAERKIIASMQGRSHWMTRDWLHLWSSPHRQ